MLKKWNILRGVVWSIVIIGLIMISSCGSDNKNEWHWDDEGGGDGEETVEKPRYIWVDAAANFPDFANSKENIARDLKLAQEAGFTDIVVDVRPTNGNVLFQTSRGTQVTWLGAWVSGTYTKVNRTATWDYLQVFIDEGHKLGLKIHAGFNTFVGGNVTSLGKEGLLFEDPSKDSWATRELTAGGIINTIEDNSTTGARFFNPVNADVQDYICGLLEDLAAYEDLDGIILDRGRFDNFYSDFSDDTKAKFENYIGTSISNFPDDVMNMSIREGSIPTNLPPHFKKWLEFRVKVIHDFVVKVRERVKAKNPDIKLGVYVGAWFSTYYAVGVNWASPKYNVAAKYSWATADYMKYGYADHLDQMLVGAYAGPTRVFGSTEWTIEGFCSLAKNLVMKDVPVCGGPDVGNGDWATAGDAVVNHAITQSVGAAINACDGYFLFDMIHLKLKNQWPYAKQGIDQYLTAIK